MKFLARYIRRACGYDQLTEANRELSLALELALTEHRNLAERVKRAVSSLEDEMDCFRNEDLPALAALIKAKTAAKTTAKTTAKKKGQ